MKSNSATMQSGLLFPRLSSKSVSFSRALSRAVCLALGLVGLAVLAGWVMEESCLTNLLPNWPAMKPNTAVALLLAAGALWLLADQDHRDLSSPYWRLFVWAAAVGVTVIGVLTSVEHAFAVDLHVDNWLVRGNDPVHWGSPGRMSPMAALDFLLLGAALCLITGKARAAGIWIAQVAALVAAFGAFIAVTGYLYDERAFGSASFLTNTALHTAVVLLALSVAVACARPDAGLMGLFNADSAGGVMLRRLLLPIVLLPVIINWLEQEGERRGAYPVGFAWMLDSAVTVFLLGFVIWMVSLKVHEQDLARFAAEEAMRRSEERYRQLVEMSPVAILVKNTKRIEFANPAARALVGATSGNELVGKSPFAFVHPETRVKFEKNLCRVLEDGTSLPRMEQRVVRLDGREVEVELSATPVDYHGRRLAQVVVRDVSEAKRAAQALRESEQRFRLIAETIDEVFWIADVKLERIVYVSPSYEKVWGRSCASVREHPQSFLEAVHPDDRARVLAGLEVEKQGLPFEHEYRLIRPDGLVRWVWDRGYPVRHAGGAVLEYVGVAQDITERKHAETQLRFQASLLDQVRNAVIATDSAGRIVYWNRFATTIYQWIPEEALTRNLVELLFPEEEQARAAAMVAGMRATGGWEGELAARRKDGRVFPVHFAGTPLNDDQGRMGGIIGVSFELTERKRTEATLRRDARILGQLHDAVICMDPDGVVTYWNDAATRLLGWTAMETVGRPFLDRYPPEEHAVRWRRFQQVLAGTDLQAERERARKDGTRVWISSRIRPYHDESGRSAGLICVARDVTERKRAEETIEAGKAEVQRVTESIFRFVPKPLLVFSENQALLKHNLAFEELIHTHAARLGYAEEEMKNALFREIHLLIKTGGQGRIRILPKRNDRSERSGPDDSVRSDGGAASPGSGPS